MPDVTLYHNPACGTSRKVLGMIREAGIEPRVVEYLKTPPGAEVLAALAAQLGGVRALLREKGTPYHELGLGDPKWTDAELLAAIGKHPILLNRPIVATGKGAKLCRPPELVATLL